MRRQEIFHRIASDPVSNLHSDPVRDEHERADFH
jgi:hypothetical protein